MSPEERASTWASYEGTSIEEQIANCIRVAENDVLEAAAIIFEKSGLNQNLPEDYAAALRAMKHK